MLAQINIYSISFSFIFFLFCLEFLRRLSAKWHHLYLPPHHTLLYYALYYLIINSSTHRIASRQVFVEWVELGTRDWIWRGYGLRHYQAKSTTYLCVPTPTSCGCWVAARALVCIFDDVWRYYPNTVVLVLLLLLLLMRGSSQKRFSLLSYRREAFNIN